MACCWLMVVFLVLFPKGGIKLGPAPVTWGYVLLAATTPLFLLLRLLALPLRFPRRVLAAFALVIPMLAVFLDSAAVYGVSDPAFAFNDILSLGWLPLLFLLIYPPFLPYVDSVKLSSWLRNSMFLAALWGLFLFAWHPLTGHFIEVPYLTVNAADYGKIEATKHISRGLFFKVISTYNNGNVYGVATLILLPLYERLEPRLWRRLTLKLALLLTLSRTVWFGLLLNEALPVIVHLWTQLRTFPIVRMGRFGNRLLALAATLFLILLSVPLVNGDALNFILDPTAGGRIGQVTSIGTPTLLPGKPLSAFTEIVYASTLRDYGIVGLLALLLILLGPVLLLLIDRRPLQSPLRRAALKGLILYAFLALSDGAINYIPVTVFFWFAYMVYLCDWPGLQNRPSIARHAPTSSLNSTASARFDPQPALQLSQPPPA
jgi:hypothetical protein